MALKRGQSGLAGVVVIDKPAKMTSHDVVARCRRLFGEKRIGHAGTLDPDATGVLVVCVGSATRLVPYFTTASKTYDARICFGSETNTDDAEGEVTVTAAVPDEVADPFFAQGFVASLVGEHEQVPPVFSAVKVDGKVAYKEARRGEEIELTPRAITVNTAELIGIECDPATIWNVRFDVSKGTYIRALARDIGRALGSAAHLCGLRRVSSGIITIDQAVTLEELEQALLDTDDPSSVFIDPIPALGLPVMEVDEKASRDITNGKTLHRSQGGEDLDEAPLSDSEKYAETTCGVDSPACGRFASPQSSDIVALLHDGKLLAFYRAEDELLKPEVVFAGGVSGVGR